MTETAGDSSTINSLSHSPVNLTTVCTSVCTSEDKCFMPEGSNILSCPVDPNSYSYISQLSVLHSILVFDGKLRQIFLQHYDLRIIGNVY